MGGDESKAFYENFLSQMKKNYKPDLIKGNNDHQLMILYDKPLS